MGTTLQTVCPNCGVANRVPQERFGDRPKCGKCHQALFKGQPLELSENQFEQLIAREELPVVVDFWAPWCNPCLAMAPVFAGVAESMEPRARFVKINTEQVPRLSQQFGIRSIPMLMVFKQGRPVDAQAGTLPADSLRLWVAKNL
jgi:thioredoxin 2